ncbi:hypothetical protein KSF78_0006008 [Schistosoma japonicum]|nr:hypothetical protein KSF78_0006008 [Schistosoma japonicum]
MASRKEVLKLYKNLLSYVNDIEHSDKTYLKQKIRSSFKESMKSSDNEAARLYKKGCEVLRLKRFI